MQLTLKHLSNSNSFGYSIYNYDRSRLQLKSYLVKAVSRLLGVKQICTTAYNAQSNELIEEFYQPLEGAFMCHEIDKCPKIILTILLGFRVAFKENMDTEKNLRLQG
ncbi:hypothetical protein NPIL_53721 [Nephila pilipes]|uniref:Uncharacterized protein n=1 Tax=Nephila pilipes TaxID=299642 RepID=A0A8X6PAW9_NEPPI|nr:hypothetical protein NPIL_53721 [Nephila pilipes]